MGVCFTKKKSEEVIKLSANEKPVQEILPNEGRILENKILQSGHDKKECNLLFEKPTEINEIQKENINEINEPNLIPSLTNINEAPKLDQKVILNESLQKLMEKVSEEKNQNEEESSDYSDYEPLFNLV
jgi:hypothetical protein